MSGKALRRLAIIGAAGLMVWVAGAANARTQANLYGVNTLVSDSAATPAPAADASLINGWGLTAGPTTPWWAANNGTSTSTLYSGAGAKQALTVTVAGGPTGAVFNGIASDFVVNENGKSGAARFLFATEAERSLAGRPPSTRTSPSAAPIGPGRARSTRGSRPRTTSCMQRTSTTDESTSSTSRSISSQAGSATRRSRNSDALRHRKHGRRSPHDYLPQTAARLTERARPLWRKAESRRRTTARRPRVPARTF